jgi:predicted GH43/DUF377 family glycosyl hydrolase
VSDLVSKSTVTLRSSGARNVVRPFSLEDPPDFVVKDHPRTQRIIERILSLDDTSIRDALARAVASYQGRHRDLEGLFMARYQQLADVSFDHSTVHRDRALLIGAYFSEEFSFESAALFNPSIVCHPDQSGVATGDTRFVLSLRGIGEGHISSLTFRTGTWKADGQVVVEDPSPFATGPRLARSEGGQGQLVVHLDCGDAETISETVVYPFMPSQGRGIEDVRLVAFTEDDGTTDFRGTYTAFNGSDVRQGMLRTADFKSFEMRGVQGAMYAGKGMALFPRRIGGRYFMLGRQDNENIWVLSSDDLYTWEGGVKTISPRSPWEFIQMGNCGSPTEVDEGWLVMTHGVGLMRNYCIGACLLDKDDPTKVLARGTGPLLEPDEHARDGYVPNVVYSCGALLRGRTLLLPYGVADSFTAFATVDVDRLIGSMT